MTKKKKEKKRTKNGSKCKIRGKIVCILKKLHGQKQKEKRNIFGEQMLVSYMYRYNLLKNV